MAAVTPTEVSVEDFPNTGNYGTYKRRARVLIRTTAAANKTLDIATYVPGATDIEGIVYETDDGAVLATASTWSTTTLTFNAGLAGSGEGCFVVTFG